MDIPNDLSIARFAKMPASIFWLGTLSAAAHHTWYTWRWWWLSGTLAGTALMVLAFGWWGLFYLPVPWLSYFLMDLLKAVKGARLIHAQAQAAASTPGVTVEPDGVRLDMAVLVHKIPYSVINFSVRATAAVNNNSDWVLGPMVLDRCLKDMEAQGMDPDITRSVRDAMVTACGEPADWSDRTWPNVENTDALIICSTLCQRRAEATNEPMDLSLALEKGALEMQRRFNRVDDAVALLREAPYSFMLLALQNASRDGTVVYPAGFDVGTAAAYIDASRTSGVPMEAVADVAKHLRQWGKVDTEACWEAVRAGRNVPSQWDGVSNQLVYRNLVEYLTHKSAQEPAEMRQRLADVRQKITDTLSHLP